MSPWAISLVAFACIFGGAMFGMFLRPLLPDHHLSEESKDAVKLGIGMIATLAALVVGLLIASAKGSFDTASNGLRQTGARIIMLDRVMAHYGPETAEARHLLRGGVAEALERIWPEDRIGPGPAKAHPGRGDIGVVQEKLLRLTPRTEEQRWLQSKALQLSGDIAEGRWLLIEQMVQSSLPMPFFVMLLFWFMVIFFTFGLFSPRNATVLTVLFVCALSTAGSLFLIMELDAPYGGLLKIESAPIRNALALIGGITSGTP